MSISIRLFIAIACGLLLSSLAAGEVVVVTEDFSTDAANWAEGTAPFDTVVHVASGGPDGGAYVTTTVSADGMGDYTLFRGHDAYDSSGDAFTGDWTSAGYTQLSAYVRHNAPTPLTYFARIATRTTTPFFSDNFPAALAIEFAPVPPGVWTELVFDVTTDSPQLVSFEGSSHGHIFSDITNVQFGFSLPENSTVSFNDAVFDLDKVALAVPEPATGLLAGGVAVLLFFRSRR